MSIKKPQRKPWMLVAIVFAVIGMLPACVQEKPAPERPFTTMELLIGPSDMPGGWQVVRGPEQNRDYFSSKDSSIIVFTADIRLNPGREGASHAVYRYRSATAAKGVYEELMHPVGETPQEWRYQSPIADQSRFTCYDYEGREPYPVCEWVARYEEYVVIFNSWLIPGRMSLQDMERVVRAIDARMGLYLDKTATPTPSAP